MRTARIQAGAAGSNHVGCGTSWRDPDRRKRGRGADRAWHVSCLGRCHAQRLLGLPGRYRVGEPAEFTYEVVTDGRVPPIHVAASQGCGSCGTFSDDALSFTGYFIQGTSAGGQNEQYCVCDVGCCPPQQAATYTITPGKRTATIQWSGRNWFGPSDTSTPQGAFFPPGSYGVHVAFDGAVQAGGVEAVLPIEIVP